MAICGYNKKIGGGLQLLFIGMIDSMEEKAAKIDDEIRVLDDEIRELDIMIDKMRDKGVIQDIFVGLNVLAKHFFIEIRRQLLENSNESIRSISNKLYPAFILTVKGAENYRNALELEPVTIDDEDYQIKLVADWVNEFGNLDNSEGLSFEV